MQYDNENSALSLWCLGDNSLQPQERLPPRMEKRWRRKESAMLIRYPQRMPIKSRGKIAKIM
ncbi:Uncharacterized protein ChrSV_2892 [Chromobacterium vaccinii]|nr:Uncharacterized protein ChrSW_2892 [Chromobacterium vaccinii]QND90349.1 Uncharacterized protein ChrSV_2892 [Chromobacterium vaccinii]